MHTNYRRGVKLILDEGRVCTAVLLRCIQDDPSNVCRLMGYATFEVSPRTGHMLACDFRSAASHAVPLIFILAGFIRLKLFWVVLYADLIGKIA